MSVLSISFKFGRLSSILLKHYIIKEFYFDHIVFLTWFVRAKRLKALSVRPESNTKGYNSVVIHE